MWNQILEHTSRRTKKLNVRRILTDGGLLLALIATSSILVYAIR